MKQVQYSLYKGEDELAFGTLEEIALKMGVKKESIRFYGTDTYKRRNNDKTSRRLIKI